MAGLVFVNGECVDKPGSPVPDAEIEIKGNPSRMSAEAG